MPFKNRQKVGVIYQFTEFKQLYRSSWIGIRIITTSIIRVEYMRG